MPVSRGRSRLLPELADSSVMDFLSRSLVVRCRLGSAAIFDVHGEKGDGSVSWTCRACNETFEPPAKAAHRIRASFACNFCAVVFPQEQ